MKKVLMVTTIPSTLSSFILPISSYFRNQGWRVDAMAHRISASTSCQQGFDQVWEIEWSRNPLDPRNLLKAPSLIQSILEQEKYDIVHVHTPVAAFVTRFALRNLRKQLGTKIIYTAHGFHFHPRGNLVKNLVFIALEKIAGKWTDYLTTINHVDFEAAKHHRLVPQERIRYMPGIGVDLSYYNPETVSDLETAQLREEIGITIDTPIFLSVAEFIPRKHHSDIIHAFAQLARSEAHLILVGQGLLMEQMRQLVTELGVANRIHFLGWRKDIPKLMRIAVATILVSEQEGLPRSVMESLALETPVIGTKIRGTQDLLEGGYGLLIDVGDVNELATAMSWILDNPEKAQSMGKKGRVHMAGYELQKILQLHTDLYSEALQDSDRKS